MPPSRPTMEIAPKDPWRPRSRQQDWAKDPGPSRAVDDATDLQGPEQPVICPMPTPSRAVTGLLIDTFVPMTCLGTTITAQIVACELAEAALLVIATGFTLRFAWTDERAKQYGATLIGCSFSAGARLAQSRL